jgi:L-cysteine desulfidase
VDRTQLARLLKSELERSTGCTDPGAVCLAVSRAVRELGRPPETIRVSVSPNVYKNGVNVGIPGTGRRGLVIAAALGAVLDDAELGLAILDRVDDEALREAEALCPLVTLDVRPFPDPLTIRAHVSADSERATVTIANDYSHIVEVTRNGSVRFAAPGTKTREVEETLIGCGLAHLYDLILTMPGEELDFLVEAAELTSRAAQTGLTRPAARLAGALSGWQRPLPEPFGSMQRAHLLTAAASEARMIGLQAPVMALSGSGNHGILALLAVLAVAENLASPREQLARALALSTSVTILSKNHIKRMTALCGCTVAAAPGVAAATAYLLGGSLEDASHAIQTVVATLAGMVCDGAKESCAYKIGAAAAVAVQAGYLARAGVHVPSGIGIVGRSVEETFRNLGRLNNPGMIETDRLIFELLQESAAQDDL